MGAGKTISLSGTSILLTYAIIGFFIFFVMRAMGEVLLSNTEYRSFSDFCAHYLGAWAGFFVSWSYWLMWVVGTIADCVVVGGYLQFWYPDLPTWIPALGVLAVLLTLNLFAVRVFGEMEFWFALIKVVAIGALIATGVVMIATSFVSPSGVEASLTHVIDRNAFLPHGIAGFFAGFQIAAFSFVGIELIGTTAAETKNPERTLPKAINAVPFRILFFYILSITCIISVSSWGGIAADKSPFVQLFLMAGLPAAAAIINMVVISSAMSSANSGVFATSRMLFGMSSKGKGAAIFRYLSKSSVPYVAVLFSTGCMLLGLLMLFVVPEVMKAFTILSTVTAILCIFIWSMIVAAYLVYRKRDPHLHQASMFKMPAGIFMSWACLVFFSFVILLMSFEKDTATALAAMPIWFVVLAILYRLQFSKRSVSVMPVEGVN
ncbi:D-serine/D-alanine/glycine transporter [Pseudomonas sp. RV120224-01b]|nr:D-serine/D-alanine/glycine transporter [Pseudomonas sp. RV120224-01c]PYG82646.1 D-serine/D-alanine/glycine transporter [Pseudomonas sp. RV120224-01b]